VLSGKVSKFSITSVLCVFLILYQSQSVEFCEIVIAEDRIGVNVLPSSWFILEFWFVASVR
jgi:hypothetical protein